MDNFNTKFRYGQSTSGKTQKFCEILVVHQNNNVELFLGSIQRIFKTREFSSGSTVPRGEKAIVEYTNEHIDKHLPTGHQPKRISKEEILASQDLYRSSLKLICDYYEANNANITNFNKFCLFYFLGCLHSHIPELENKAAESYKQALQYFRTFMEKKEDGVEEVKPSQIINSIQLRVSKHEVLSYNPDLLTENSSPTTLEDALAAKCYIEKEPCDNLYSDEDLVREGLEPKDKALAYCLGHNIDIPKIFKSLTVTRFSKLVLLINALDSRLHDRFKIIFQTTIGSSGYVLGGNYNQRNTIKISISEKTYGSTLCHELAHRAMGRVFENFNCPYFSANETAKMAYRKSMRQVLINFMLVISPNLEISDWSLDKLVKKYFTESSHFITIGLNRLKKINQDELYIWSLHEKLRNIFTVYLISTLDIEFITNVSQFINEADKNSKYFAVIKPLMDFIDMHVIPEMEKYIAEHPCRGQIIET